MRNSWGRGMYTCGMQERGFFGRVWNALGVFILVFLATGAALGVGALGVLWFLGEEVLGGRTSAEAWAPAFDCNVVGIAVRGPIVIASDTIPAEDCVNGCPVVTASDDVLEYLRTASENDAIKGVILDIESGGGYPVPSEEIANAVAEVGKPSVAWVRQIAASGAYWIASAADTIVASPNSDVGSIGVSMSYLDYSGQNEEDGLNFNSLSSGKFKDTGSPDKPLTDEERTLLERDIKITHANFVAAVAANRGLTVEQVQAMADGSTMLGAMAQGSGLVDALGGQSEAYAALATAIGEEPVICWAGI